MNQASPWNILSLRTSINTPSRPKFGPRTSRLRGERSAIELLKWRDKLYLDEVLHLTKNIISFDLVKIYNTAVPTTEVIGTAGKRKEYLVCFSNTRNSCTGMLWLIRNFRKFKILTKPITTAVNAHLSAIVQIPYLFFTI